MAKELELYAGEEPQPDYALDVEIEGILRAAEASGFDRFHLVGYSAGGAASLAFAAKHPKRLRSLALLEPAWAGNDGRDPPEEAVWREFHRIMALPPEEIMPAFVRCNLAPGVEPPPPPPGPSPPWMANRPAGLQALTRAFRAGELDLDALRGLQAPVYFALGGLSNPDHYAKIAERLAGVFPNFTLERVRGVPSLRPAAPGGVRAARFIASRPMGPCRDRLASATAARLGSPPREKGAQAPAGPHDRRDGGAARPAVGSGSHHRGHGRHAARDARPAHDVHVGERRAGPPARGRRRDRVASRERQLRRPERWRRVSAGRQRQCRRHAIRLPRAVGQPRSSPPATSRTYASSRDGSAARASGARAGSAPSTCLRT